MSPFNPLVSKLNIPFHVHFVVPSLSCLPRAYLHTLPKMWYPERHVTLQLRPNQRRGWRD